MITHLELSVSSQWEIARNVTQMYDTVHVDENKLVFSELIGGRDSLKLVDTETHSILPLPYFSVLSSGITAHLNGSVMIGTISAQMSKIQVVRVIDKAH